MVNSDIEKNTTYLELWSLDDIDWLIRHWQMILLNEYRDGFVSDYNYGLCIGPLSYNEGSLIMICKSLDIVAS